MTKIVNSWNDFDPLKHVIVGRADHSCIPPEEPATSEKVPIDSTMRGMWGPRPLETVEKAKERLNSAGEKIDDAADKAGHELRKAGEEVKDAAAKGAEKVEKGACTCTGG